MHCPVCNAEVYIDFSSVGGDAPCPACGTLIRKSGAIADQVRRILANHFQLSPDQIRLDSTLKGLGGTSLDTVELIMELEEVLDVQIPDEAAERVHSVEDLLRYLENLHREQDEI